MGSRFDEALAFARQWQPQPEAEAVLGADEARDRFWLPLRCDDLPPPLDLVCFDTAACMGPRRALEFLRRSLGLPARGDFDRRMQDELKTKHAPVLAHSYGAMRESFCRQLAEETIDLQAALPGWLARLAALQHATATSLVGTELPPAEAAEPFDDLRKLRDPVKWLSDRAAAAMQHLTQACDDDEVDALKPLLFELRNDRLYPPLLQLAEALHRRDPEDATVRRLHAQALIETGQASVAVDLLEALVNGLNEDHPETLEAQGLLGRAWKQIYLDSACKTSPQALHALRRSIEAYRMPYERQPDSTWHGVNLLALLHLARRAGLDAAADLEVPSLARRLLAVLARVPKEQRDEWHLPTEAEAALGLGDWDRVEELLQQYLADPAVPAFLVASTLRQFRDVWQLEDTDDRGRGIVKLLCARLLRIENTELRLAPAQAIRQREGSVAKGQPEAVLGEQGSETLRWWATGQQRARSVGAVRRRLGKRIGTCFVVRAGDLGLASSDELLVLTNWHVVNERGLGKGIRPQDAEIVFELADASTVFKVEQIVWSAPMESQDACLLRVTPALRNIDPLPIAASLPAWPPEPQDGARPLRRTRVYVIGHPAGGELTISFQDNELLGHEGPPTGKPPKPGVCRVHYRAPTEPGSSGSPVFDDTGWEVIALHHMGGKDEMDLLNGESGSYSANEGIAMSSVIDAIRRGPPVTA